MKTKESLCQFNWLAPILKCISLLKANLDRRDSHHHSPWQVPKNKLLYKATNYLYVFNNEKCYYFQSNVSQSFNFFCKNVNVFSSYIRKRKYKRFWTPCGLFTCQWTVKALVSYLNLDVISCMTRAPMPLVRCLFSTYM